MTKMHISEERMEKLWQDFEIANASGVGMDIDESLFIYPEEVEMVCGAFDIDPAAAIAEGSLLITVRPNSSDPP